MLENDTKRTKTVKATVHRARVSVAAGAAESLGRLRHDHRVSFTCVPGDLWGNVSMTGQGFFRVAVHTRTRTRRLKRARGPRIGSP